MEDGLVRQRFLDRPLWFRAITFALLLGAAISAIIWVGVAILTTSVPRWIEPIGVVLATAAALMQFWAPKSSPDETNVQIPGNVGPTPRAEKATFRALSVTKVVDLRDNHIPVKRTVPSGDSDAPAAGGLSLITDMYLLRRTDNLTDRAAFFYSTSGVATGTSATHAASSIWQPIEGEHMRRSYELRTTLADLQVDGVVRVVNRVEYFAAFDGATDEYVETHIDRPTGSLTWVVLFADSRPCRSSTGRVRRGRLWREEKKNPPVILEDGQLVIWQVGDSDSPLEVGDAFGLQWAWDRLDPGVE